MLRLQRRLSSRPGVQLLALLLGCGIWGQSFVAGTRVIEARAARDAALWESTAAAVNARAQEGAAFAPCELREQMTHAYMRLAQSVRGITWAATAIAADVADGCVHPAEVHALREQLQDAIAHAAALEAAALPWPGAQLKQYPREIGRAHSAVERALIESRAQQCYFEISRALREIHAPGPQSGLSFYVSCSRFL